MQRALAEIALLGVAGGALGCWVVLYESLLRGRVARPLDLPRAGARGARRRPAAARRRAGDRRRGAGDRRSPAGCPGSSRDVAVAVVVTTMFGLGVLLALSPDSPPGIESAALRRHPRRPATPTCSRPRAARRARSPRRSRLLHGRLLADRLRPRRRALARRLARPSSTRRCCCCSRRRSSSPSRASATCSSSPSSSARRRPRAGSPTGSCR